MDKQTDGRPTNPRRSIWRTTLGHFFIGLIAAGLVGVVVWGGMRFDADRRVSAVRKRCMGDVETAQGRLAATIRHDALMTTQVQLYDSAIALERRNFGTANAALRDATTTLETLKDDPESGTKIALLRQSIAGVNLAVANDVSDQRKQVLDLVRQTGNLVSDSQSH